MCIVVRRIPFARLKKPLSDGRFGDLPAFRAGVRTENVETPEQRVAAGGQAGSPEAKKSDKLILGNRTFYIIDLDEVGSLGISTIYYAEERKDVK